MSSIRRKIRRFIFFLTSFFVLAVLFLVSVFAYYLGQIPDPTVITARRVSESTKIFDRTGEVLLYDIHGNEKRTIIPWEQMPGALKNAVLASEDAEYYTHRGVDFKGIIRAFYKDVTSFSLSQGGSTITQQLIKNSLLTKEKVFSRKIKEAALSILMEKKFSKDEIFWMYLNQIPFGSNIYGVEAASLAFFGKRANEISLAESAVLAALIKAPSYYSPYGNHFRETLERKDYILQRMEDLGFINETAKKEAQNQQLSIRPLREEITAPHFVIMVKEYLIKKYGEDMVTNGGLKVVTSLDTKLQKIAEEAVTKFGQINQEKYKANNAALAAANPKNGQLLAMVGSRDYFDIVNDGNYNVAIAYRQPGSSFKPFAYAKFLEKGFTDSAILFDLKTEFNPNCSADANEEVDYLGIKCYHPQNYDGLFRGPVSARSALAQSLNVPSVKVLYLAGVGETIDLATRLGITSLKDKNRFGLSLVLGGGEVRLVDMVAAYGVFANDGVKNPLNFVLKVVASDGTILEEFGTNEERVVDSQTARLITDILSDNKARAPVFGYSSSLYLSDRPVAAKTGTTQENRDGWLIGYTPSLVAGVWTGNNNNDSMTKQGAGISAAGPLWHEFMTLALKDAPAENFIEPNPVKTEKIMLDGNYISPYGIHTILYFVYKEDPLGPYPTEPQADPQFNNWEKSVQRWLGF
jgi:1A family penicillin-binding protein